MTPFRTALALLLASAAADPALAQAQAQADKPFTAADIEAAAFAAGGLPSGRSPLTAKVQMLLDRAGISPGVTDGFRGGMSESAIRAFERQRGLAIDGILDAEVWAQLQPYAAEPVTQTYTVTAADVADLVAAIPSDYAEKAAMPHLGYTSVAEKLAERFHMDEKFIAFLNPGVSLDPGATITVMRPAKALKGQVARIIVDKAAHRVAAYDANDRLIVDYPATIGSDATPSPSGIHMVEGVALNPDYTYNPNVNFKQGDNDKVLTIPPGPNGPVGTVWIDLDKPTYGIHGTPTPSRLFVNESHGCVRLTNWDAWELAHMVKRGVTRVEFLPPGTGITDVIPPVPAAPAAGVAATTLPVAAGAVPGAMAAATPAGTQGRPLPRPAGVIMAAAAAAGTGAAVPVGPAGTVPGATTGTIAGAAPLPGTVPAALPATAGAGTLTPPASGADLPAAANEATAAAAAAAVPANDPLAAALNTASGGAAPVQTAPTPTPFALPQPGVVTITPAEN